MFGKIENGTLIVAPSSIVLEGGISISNFEMVANEHGFKNVIFEEQPLYDWRYQCLEVYYEEDEKNIFEKYRVIEMISLDLFKQQKIDEFNEICNKTILDGFTALGHHFIFDEEAQHNFEQQMIMVLLAIVLHMQNANTLVGMTEEELNGILPYLEFDTVEWKTEDCGELSFTKKEFLQVILTAAIHKNSNIARYRARKRDILACEGFLEVLAIVW